MDIVFSADQHRISASEQMSLREIVQAAARDLLRHDRRRVHVHQRSGAEALVAGAARVDPLRRRTSAPTKKKHILERLTAAEGLERYLHTKYVGQKRFSLEGGESFIAVDGRAGAARRRHGRAGNRHRHGAPRPPERAGQHARQDADGPVRRIRRQARRRPAGRRRQVPQGLLVATSRPTAARSTCRWRSTRRTSRSSTRWSKVRCKARMDRRGDTDGAAGAAGAGARRRRLRRPGRRDGDAEPRADARLRHAAARCTSSSTTRSASRPRTRATRARRCTARTSSR